MQNGQGRSLTKVQLGNRVIRKGCVRDEGRSLAVGRQGQTVNRLELRRLRAEVVNVKLKRPCKDRVR